jgi:hypothetical protein
VQGRVEIKPEVVEQDSEYQVKIFEISLFANIEDTGKPFLETLILVSTNPQYDNKLFIKLRVQ